MAAGLHAGNDPIVCFPVAACSACNRREGTGGEGGAGRQVWERCGNRPARKKERRDKSGMHGSERSNSLIPRPVRGAPTATREPRCAHCLSPAGRARGSRGAPPPSGRRGTRGPCRRRGLQCCDRSKRYPRSHPRASGAQCPASVGGGKQLLHSKLVVGIGRGGNTAMRSRGKQTGCRRTHGKGSAPVHSWCRQESSTSSTCQQGIAVRAVQYLREVAVVEADDKNAPVTQPAGQQRPPCLVSDGPGAT